MDKNIIKQYLDKTFLSEVTNSETNGTPGIRLAGKMNKDNAKINKAGVGEIGKEMKKYEKGLTKTDPNQKTMSQNKINYNTDEEKNYHDQMEIMNGQEMIQYDREPNKMFKDRALEAIEGSTRMGNNSEWANVVAKGQGGDPEFGKNLVKSIKASEKLRSKETPTSKMFGNDWEVIADKGHKPYAFESEDKTKCSVCDKSKKDCKCTDKEKAVHAMKGLDADYEKDDRKVKYKYNEDEKTLNEVESCLKSCYAQKTKGEEKDCKTSCYAKKEKTATKDTKTNKKTEIKETMKRLKFKKEFNGVGNALKLIPESYKVDNKIFEMTDGNENYRIRWEGSVNEGSAVVLMASDKTLVNENMQKMKHLMGYKSQETLGTVRGKERINENASFMDVWNKTKKLMNEIEDNEGDDAENGMWDDAITSQAADAKKHIEGSTSADKGTQAPKPKTGNFDDAITSQAPEASKHVQGSASGEKGMQAPKPKTGNLEDAITSQSPEAKKHLKSESVKKKITEAEFSDDDDELSDKLDNIKDKGEEDDAPVMKRKDAYDATLDVPDPEDMEKSISKTDIEKTAEPIINKDMTGDDEDDVKVPELKNSPYKLMYSPSKDEYAIILSMGGKKEIVAMIPPNDTEMLKLARKDPSAAAEAINAPKEMSDDDIMEAINKMLG